MPRPTAEMKIQLVDDIDEDAGTAPAYVFRLADAENPAGHSFQATVEYAEGGDDEGRVEGKLTVTQLTGLGIKEAKRIRKSGFVRMDAGYLDKSPRKQTIFYGQVDSLTYELNNGQLLWTMRASATPGRLYFTKVRLDMTGAATYAEIFERLLTAAGISGGNFAPEAQEHSLIDYSTKGGTFIEEVRDLVLQLRRDVSAGGQTGTDIVAIPFVGAPGDQLASLFLVNKAENFPESFGRINLDLAHSGSPEVDSKAISDVDSEADEDDILEASAAGESRFNVVIDLEPRIRNFMQTQAFSDEFDLRGTIKVDNYKHTIGPKSWQTQFSGPSEGI